MYIGKEPIVGNFQKCDAITVVNGQAAYTLQVSSTNVTPESANHMLVSLNGILQAPVTSFTVSGSTLTFASNLATGDVIDFVILLGNVLDLGTPSDGTVTNAKLASDLISGETDIGGAIADADLFLMDDGAGGTLRKTAASRIKTYVGGGLSVADQWRLNSAFSMTSSSFTAITANLERVDTSGQGVISAMTESSGIFTFPSTGIYLVTADFAYGVDNDSSWIEGTIQATINNADYASIASNNTFIQRTETTTTYQKQHVNSLVDVTNTTNVKVKFGVARNSNTISLLANSAVNVTYFTFLRLGDT
jgi:hypothetical protein